MRVVSRERVEVIGSASGVEVVKSALPTDVVRIEGIGTVPRHLLRPVTPAELEQVQKMFADKADENQVFDSLFSALWAGDSRQVEKSAESEGNPANKVLDSIFPFIVGRAEG